MNAHLFSLLVLLSFTFAHLAFAQRARFVESANDAGVAGPSPKIGNGHGAVFADFNRDGLLDLCYTVKEFRNYLHLNNGNATFRELAENAGLNTRTHERIRGVTAADYDNDGDVDLFMCAGLDDILYRNNGDLTFTDVTDAAGVRNRGNGLAGTWGDYDRDGNIDLYVANWNENVHALYRNRGDGTFVETTAQAGLGEDDFTNIGLWFDYNNDGELDLFVSRWNDRPHRLWRNNGNGTFTNVAAQAGLANTVKGQGAALADYDNDGWLDIYLASDNAPNLLMRNNGNGTFTNVAARAGVDDGRRSVDCAWGDFDADGAMDLYVGNYDAPNALYFNNGDGSFTEASGVTADYDRTIGTTVADFDNDGALDFFTVNSETANRLYRNLGHNNNWLKVELEGVESNRSAIGARVRVSVNGKVLVQEVSGGSGYCSQNALVLYFGLGANARAEQVEIRWPSGEVERLQNVPAKQWLKLREGASIVTNPVAPAILNARLHWLNATTLQLAWETDTPCLGQVEFGFDSTYGKHTALTNTFTTQHQHVLTALAPDTLYHYRMRVEDESGNRTMSNDAVFRTGALVAATPLRFRLSRVYPNPVREATHFDLELPESGRVEIVVYDLEGREVEKVYDANLISGNYSLRWEPRTRALPAGIYFLRARWQRVSKQVATATLRLLLLR